MYICGVHMYVCVCVYMHACVCFSKYVRVQYIPYNTYISGTCTILFVCMSPSLPLPTNLPTEGVNICSLINIRREEQHWNNGR